ncbi:S49 family peptidase [Acinetobacter baumannii]|nr:S49 family peptidase [Acinetobacter baumannii]
MRYIKEYFKKLFSRGSNLPKTVTYKVKKRTWLEILYTTLGICLTLMVIYSLNLNLNIYENIKNSFISDKHIAVIRITGTISPDTNANGTNISKALVNAFENEDSQAIVLEINSGGGSPYQAEMVWNEIQYLKQKYPNKKVYALIQDIGASAAYQIASASDYIIVGKSSLVGSIGVIMSNYDLTKLMDKIGVDDRTLTAGSNKAAFSFTKKVTDEQMVYYQNMLNNVHHNFIKYVRDGRKGKLKESDDMFSGLVWTGEQAVQVGIADKVGDMNTLKRDLKIDTVKNYTYANNGLGALFNSAYKSIGRSIGQGFSDSLKEENSIELR